MANELIIHFSRPCVILA